MGFSLLGTGKVLYIFDNIKEIKATLIDGKILVASWQSFKRLANLENTIDLIHMTS